MLGVVPLPRPTTTPAPPEPSRLLAVEPLRLHARDSIEHYLDALNRASPVAQRQIRRWSPNGPDWLGVSAVLHAESAGTQPTEVFIGEGQFSFDVEMARRNADAAPDAYVVGLPVTGRMSVTIDGCETLAGAGEGVIVDPARVERTVLSGEAHFVEFYLPRREMLRLAAEWAPGIEPHAPLFEPHLRAPLAQRLLFMATQAAQLLQAPGPAAGKQMLFGRWIDAGPSELATCRRLHPRACRHGDRPGRHCRRGLHQRQQPAAPVQRTPGPIALRVPARAAGTRPRRAAQQRRTAGT